MYEDGDKHCFHGPNCKRGKACEVGKRTQHKHVLMGSLLVSMRKAEAIISKNTGNAYKCKVVRVIETGDDGKSVIGLEIPTAYCMPCIQELQEEDM